MHSAAIRIRSAFSPSMRYRNPLPSSPTSVSRRHFEVVEEQLRRRVVHHRADRTDRQPVADRLSARSTSRTDSPSVRFFTCSIGVVRTTSSRRSECSAREIQTFWPRMTYRSPLRVGRRLQLRRVRSGGRLGDAECLQPQRAGWRSSAGTRASARRIRAAAACPSCTSARGRRRRCRRCG